MNLARGFYQTTDENGKVTIRETFTCCHCGKPTLKPLPGEDYGYCKKCDARECIPCALKNRCTPFESKIEAAESRGRMLAAIGIK